MFSCFVLGAILLASAAMAVAHPAATQAAAASDVRLDNVPLIPVGVARVDITPSYPIRLNGFLVRKEESLGARQAIWAKAMAIGADSDQPAVLITVDTLGIPSEITAEVARRLADKTGLAAERLAITASHTHSGPMINGCAPNIFGEPIPPDAQARIDQYTRELVDNLEQVALAALKDRQPARLDWGIGLVRFAKNRRDKNGPYDHDMPLMVVRAPTGQVRAVWVSYACHCVTLSDRLISGDWAGYAQEQIEKRYPGAVAMVSIGCAGDQNPTSGVMNDRADLAQGQGEEIAAEVERLLSQPLRPITGPLVVNRQTIHLPLAAHPTRDEFEKLAEQPTPAGYHAKVQLAKLARGEQLRREIEYPVQSWCWGDSLALVFLPGEVVSEYGLQIKSRLNAEKLWVNAYANACPCYIPSEKVLQAGGYEGGGAMIYYDQPAKFAPGLEEKILAAVTAPLEAQFPPLISPGKAQGTRPRAPEQSLKLMSTDPGLQVDLIAAEPLVTSPVAVAFGPDGKVWLAEMFDYPSGVDGSFGPGGRIRCLESSRGDGHFDRSSIFLEGIPFPTGVTVWRRGLLICAAPDILYAEDTDGDGRADVCRKLYSGFGTDNYQARVNSLEYGLDGWVYGSCGLFGGTISRPFFGQESVALGDRDFRIRPDTGELEPAVGRTQQGRVRDCFDHWFGCSNSAFCFHYPLADEYMRRNPYAPPPPGAINVPGSPEANRVFPASDQLQLFKLSGGSGTATAACGLGIYRDTLLGEAYQGNVFTCEPVNLLVHRLTLQSKGSSFSGQRPANEAHSEFLASTDTWFRPVQARTAPDGSLWVLDMYRFVIEHPRWIPQETLAQVDLRAGSNLGRIYRVRPAALSAPLQWPRLEPLNASQLVAALNSANGWQRDMAMQLLVWNHRQQASALAPQLQVLARLGERWEVRVQALATLAQLGQLTADDILVALAESHPGIQRLAVRLSEGHAGTRLSSATDHDFKLAGKLLDQLLKLTRAEDGPLRVQVACSLGAWSQEVWARDQAARGLVDLALAHPSDAPLQAAVLSSLNQANAQAVITRLTASEPSKLEPVASRLLPVCLALADNSSAVELVTTVALWGKDQPLAAWQLAVQAAIFEQLAKHPKWLDELRNRKNLDSVEQAIARAQELATSASTPEPVRIAALAVTQRGLEHFHTSPAADVLNWLTPQSSVALQSAIVACLLASPDPAVAESLLDKWPEYSPALKAEVLGGMLQGGEGIAAVLKYLERKELPEAELDAARRQQLLKHPDAAIRARAEKIFAGGPNPDRRAVLDSYTEVSQLEGNSERGRDLFQKHCSTCHRLHDTGHAVGPDLTALATKPVSYFLQEMLDPNRNLDSRYMSYTAVTASGQTHTGLLAAETATAITLRGPDAKEVSFQRSELEQLKATRASLMPEGLERLLPPQAMADVIVFVRSPQVTPVQPESLAAGELARDLLNDKLPADVRQQRVAAAAKIAAEVIIAMAANMPRNEAEEYRRIPWIWRVAVNAGKEGDDKTLRQVLECALPLEGSDLRDWQAVVIGGGIVNGLTLRGDWPRGKIEQLLADAPQVKARWHRTIAQSFKMADDEKVRHGTRYDALRIVAMADWDQCRDLLQRYCAEGVEGELQQGAVSGLADIPHLAAAEHLVASLTFLTAGNRRFAIAALVRDLPRQRLLLDALAAGKLPASELLPAETSVLLNSSDTTISTRAHQLLPPP